MRAVRSAAPSEFGRPSLPYLGGVPPLLYPLIIHFRALYACTNVLQVFLWKKLGKGRTWGHRARGAPSSAPKLGGPLKVALGV